MTDFERYLTELKRAQLNRVILSPKFIKNRDEG